MRIFFIAPLYGSIFFLANFKVILLYDLWSLNGARQRNAGPIFFVILISIYFDCLKWLKLNAKFTQAKKKGKIDYIFPAFCNAIFLALF
jgi:hypothetical protein